MRNISVIRSISLFVAVLIAVPALAHIELDAPTPRFNDGSNKWCPCGTGGDGTRANDGCEVSESDPNRGTTSTTFAAGETITVQWRETVGHTGRMRVSFDPDGADQGDFNANILADLPDPAGSIGNTGTSGVWELEVTLPNTPCTNCTLQVIQVMNGNTEDPVVDLTGTGTYFQCANLVLTGAGEGEGEGDGEGEGEGDGEGEGEGEGEDGNEGEGEGETTGCASTSASAEAPLGALLLLGVLGAISAARRRVRC